MVGHGSRRSQAIQEFIQFTAELAKGIGQPIQHRFLELADPDMANGLTQAVQTAGDGGSVVVLPLFLGSANHEKNDVAAAIQWGRAQFPRVTFRYGAPLGLHAKLVELVDVRVRQALESEPGALPSTQSAVLVVGRGSSDPDSNSEVAKLAHLLAEKRPYLFVEYAFQAVARPTIGEALRRCKLLGAQQVVVAPYILFTGRVYEDILRVSAQNGLQLGLQIVHTGYLGIHPLLLEVGVQRYQEAVDGTATVTCDVCKYRFPMAGYEQEVGLAQHTHHLHGGSAQPTDAHQAHDHAHPPSCGAS